MTAGIVLHDAPSAGRSSWLQQGGALLLILGSASTIPLARVSGVALSSDRLLGLGAVAVVALLGLRGQLRWTAVHWALAVFVAMQVATSALAAPTWPQGLKFVMVYVMGFACFALAFECARRPQIRELMGRGWIVVGAILGVIATAAAVMSNISQEASWAAADIIQQLPMPDGSTRLVFAGQATFLEWNLLSSFLLVPFALGLWIWARGAGHSPNRWVGAAVGAISFGLVFGLTRAAWLSMVGIIALWWRVERPTWRQISLLGLFLAAALLLQAVVIGASPITFRFLEPLRGVVGGPRPQIRDVTMGPRLMINRITLESSRERLLVGHGAGSLNRLTLDTPGGERIMRGWNGNIVLFVLHDSGLLGVGALLALIAVIAWNGARALRGRRPGAAPLLTVPLLTAGACLVFAYQFTHALWLMYPYVYLGLFTATLGDDFHGA